MNEIIAALRQEAEECRQHLFCFPPSYWEGFLDALSRIEDSL